MREARTQKLAQLVEVADHRVLCCAHRVGWERGCAVMLRLRMRRPLSYHDTFDPLQRNGRPSRCVAIARAVAL